MSNSKKGMDDLETEVNSPAKRTQIAFSKNVPANKGILLKQMHLEPTSLTQKQLYSRELVRNAIHQGKSKTIKHQIGNIDKNSVLYAKPRTFTANQFQFDSIPPQNYNYSSASSAKIHQINKGLITRPMTVSIKSQNRYAQKRESKKKSAQQRVSVSGIVTYKFSSINAERSLASNRINYQQKLQEDIKISNQLRDCQVNRFKKILLKHSSKRYNEHLRKQTNIMSNLDCKTDHHLQSIIKNNDKEMLLYGEKAKKLQFIKQYMSLQKTSYEQGRHIINEIERCRPKEQKIEIKRVVKTQNNQDIQFERRRIPKLNKRIKIRFLTFVE